MGVFDYPAENNMFVHAFTGPEIVQRNTSRRKDSGIGEPCNDLQQQQYQWTETYVQETPRGFTKRRPAKSLMQCFSKACKPGHAGDFTWKPNGVSVRL